MQRERVMAVGLCYAALTACAAAAPQQVAIDLALIATHVLPDSFTLSGAAVASDARVVAWSINQKYVLVLERDGRTTSVPVPTSRRLIGAGFGTDGTVRVIDADGVVYRQAGALARRAAQYAVPARSLITARLAPNGWYLQAVDSSGATAVYWLGATPRRLQRFQRDSVAINFTLSTAEHRAIISFRDPRQHPIMIDSTGAIASEFGATPPAVTTALADTQAVWIRLATVPVSGRWIQSFADMKSQDRIVATLDYDGNVLRTRRLPSIAFIDAAGAGGYVLAAQTFARAELALYHAKDNPAR